MNDEKKNQIIAEARVYWDKGLPFHTGITLFERIPLRYRGRWAAQMLEAAYLHIPPIPEVTAAIEFARTPTMLSEDQGYMAHSVFSALRNLRLETSDLDSLSEQIVVLAEHTTGITYTARQYPAPYDHNRGWRIVEEFYVLVKQIPMHEIHSWSIVANPRYILLDAPVPCNPGCPICQRPRWDYGSI
jgi:hypothetical protein